MADSVEISSKSLAEKLDKAGLDDGEKAVIAYALTSAFDADTSGFMNLLGGTLAGAGAGAGLAAGAAGGGAKYAAGIAAGAAGGGVKFGLQTVADAVHSLNGQSTSLRIGDHNINIKII